MVEENKLLTLIYSVFLGVLLAIFVGVSINTFYPGPTYPEYPETLAIYDGKEMTAEQKAIQKKFDEQSRQYNKDTKPYNRNVSLIVLGSAVLLLAVSLVLEKRGVKVIADGFMLGGLFSLVYSLGRGFAAQEDTYVFLIVTVALGVVLYLGYHRYVQPQSGKSAKKKSAK